jgi:hypothetical protein
MTARGARARCNTRERFAAAPGLDGQLEIPHHGDMGRTGVGVFVVTLASLEACESSPALHSDAPSVEPVEVTRGNPGKKPVVDQPAATDPFGACVPSDELFPYTCSNGIAPCTGQGVWSPCGPEGCGVFHVVCDNTCQVDADCPVPLTGTSRPSCEATYHFCRLPCETDADCPSGHTCQDGTLWLARGADGESLGLRRMCMQTLHPQP